MIFGKQILEYDAKHACWQDTLVFYDNGLFKRQNSACTGTYECHEQILKLRWFSWPEEVLFRAGEYYVGDRIIIQKKMDCSVSELPKSAGHDDIPLLIQLGSGENRLKGWLNLELPDFDICEPLIWDNDSVDAFFLEHVIEHVSGPDAYFFFAEAHRALKKGGILRLAFPDVIRISKNSTPEYINFLKRKGWSDGSPESAIKNIVVNHGHKSVWSVDVLTVLLKSVRFEVTPVKLGKSSNPLLRNLENHSSQLGIDFNLLETECLEAKKI